MGESKKYLSFPTRIELYTLHRWTDFNIYPTEFLMNRSIYCNRGDSEELLLLHSVKHFSCKS